MPYLVGRSLEKLFIRTASVHTSQGFTLVWL